MALRAYTPPGGGGRWWWTRRWCRTDGLAAVPARVASGAGGARPAGQGAAPAIVATVARRALSNSTPGARKRMTEPPRRAPGPFRVPNSIHGIGRGRRLERTGRTCRTSTFDACGPCEPQRFCPPGASVPAGQPLAIPRERRGGERIRLDELGAVPRLLARFGPGGKVLTKEPFHPRQTGFQGRRVRGWGRAHEHDRTSQCLGQCPQLQRAAPGAIAPIGRTDRERCARRRVDHVEPEQRVTAERPVGEGLRDLPAEPDAKRIGPAARGQRVGRARHLLERAHGRGGGPLVDRHELDAVRRGPVALGEIGPVPGEELRVAVFEAIDRSEEHTSELQSPYV